jgi:hypothetical protein
MSKTGNEVADKHECAVLRMARIELLHVKQQFSCCNLMYFVI